MSINPDNLGLAFCTALGLDPTHIAGMTLDISAGNVPTLTVRFAPTILAPEFADLVREYTLEPKHVGPKKYSEEWMKLQRAARGDV